MGAKMTEHARAEKNEITLGFIKISPIGGSRGTSNLAVQQLVDDLQTTAIPLPKNAAETENLTSLPDSAQINGK
jgi:hypothetical protein